MRAKILIAPSRAGSITGRALHLLEPISFWGGVSPVDGRLTDPRSARHNESVAGRVLLIRELRGSSSASSILLELIYKGVAPAAIILDHADAILALGAFVGREMQWPTPAMLQLSAAKQALIPDDALVSIDGSGQLTIA